MGADKGRKRVASAGRREQDALSPGDRWLLYFGGGGSAVIACATGAMIVWLFLRHPDPSEPAAPVAQAQPEVAQPLAEPAEPGVAAPPIALAPAESSPQPETTTTPPAADDPLAPFLRMELSAPATDFALDTDHGHLAAIGPWENAVGIITDQQLRDGGSVEDVAVVALQGAPTAIRYKPLQDGGLFVVGQKQPDAVVLMDPVSREIVDTIPVETGSPYWIAGSSNPESADVYLATMNATDSRSMLRLDAQARSITATWPKVLLRDFAVSFDGADVYCRVIDTSPGRGPLRPDNSAQFHWHFHPERNYTDKDRRYVVDPLGRFVVTGNRVWSPDFLIRHEDLRFEAQAFLPDRPWAAGIEDSEFIIGSLNDGRIVRRFPLPAEWHRVQDAADRQRRRDLLLGTWAELLGGQVFADPSRDQFVLAAQQHILSFPLDQLDLPDEPLLLFTEPTP